MKWIKAKTRGVRYREHPTRRYGVRRDRYYTIRYRLDGKDIEEPLGWASAGMNEERAAGTLNDIKRRIREGEAVCSLKDKRLQREAESQRQKTFDSYFDENYKPAQNAKKPQTMQAENSYYTNWIKPVIGEKILKDIRPLDIERIKRNMIKAEKSARTIEYIFAIIRQVWNMARRDNLVTGICPTREVKKPRVNNGRMRFLTTEETRTLLDAVRDKSEITYQICLVSVNCGLRAGEIFNLKWQDVSLDDGTLFIKDAKGGRSRYAFMTQAIKDLFGDMTPGNPDDYVFKDRKHGGKIQRVSNAYQRTVKKLKFNEGVKDDRNKVVFHTLRHTFASNLAKNGVDLYTIQKLMGHASFDMVQRYSHLSDDRLMQAVETLNQTVEPKQEGAEVVPLNG